MIKIVFMVTNDPKYTFDFRKELIKTLVSEGYEVHLACPRNDLFDYVERLKDLNITYHRINLDAHSKNPIKDINYLFKLKQLIKVIKPNILLTFTIKPNIYGGLAARMMKVPFIPNITGLGTAVENKGLLQKITVFLYRRALKKAQCVFFQNEENLTFMRNKGIVKDNVKRLPGSGVNLEHFTPLPYPPGETLHFLFIGRLMKEKGIELYMAMAKHIHTLYPGDHGGYGEELFTLKKEGIITYHGRYQTL